MRPAAVSLVDFVGPGSAALSLIKALNCNPEIAPPSALDRDLLMQRPRVLLIEDEGLIGICVAEDIGELGFDAVGPFDDVDSAMAAAKTEVFDFALVDINLKDEMSYAVLDVLMAAGTP